LIINSYKNNAKRRHFVWREEWINELESPWSLIEKFKFANNASSWDFMKIFGTEEVVQAKYMIDRENRDLYNLTGINDKTIQRELHFSIKQLNDMNLNNMLKVLKINETSSTYLRQYVCYCVECIRMGYHSLLHQFKLIHYCPFHLTSLSSVCPECKKKMPYEIIFNKLSGPYACKCGHILVSWSSIGHLNNWKMQEITIKDNKVSSWLHSNIIQASKIKHLVPFNLIDPDEIKDMLDIFLNIINLSDKIGISYFVSSSFNIQQLVNPLTIESHYPKVWEPIINIDTLFSEYSSVKVRTIMEDISKSSFDAIHSIEKHFRKKMLKKHKSCIQRFVRISKEEYLSHPPVCPFAYAYVSWKRSMNNITHYYNVDHWSSRKTKKNIFNFASEEVQLYIKSIINIFLKKFPIKDPEKYSHIKWAINHIVAKLAFSHFKVWLEVSSENALKFNMIKNVYFNYSVTDFFMLLIPENFTDPIEFHWINESNHGEIADSLVCPFPTIKKRRINLQEKSFHPMITEYNKIRQGNV
jgi:hypothetical protein